MTDEDEELLDDISEWLLLMQRSKYADAIEDLRQQVAELRAENERKDTQIQDLVNAASKATDGPRLALELDAAEAALAECRKDAARYRWLRGESQEVAEFWWVATRDKSITLELMDAAIDLALAKQAEGK
jgi:hypothetical protein